MHRTADAGLLVTGRRAALLPPIEYAYLQARHNAGPPPNLAGELFAEQGPEQSGTLRLAWSETLDAPSEQ